MCDKNSTYIINNLNHFCDIEIWPLNENRIFQKTNFEIENRFLQNLSRNKNMILKQL